VTVAMPARLLSPEGEAWMLRAKLLKDAFDQRENGQMFVRTVEVEQAYLAMEPAEFMEKFA
jgi:hypothetical protein